MTFLHNNQDKIEVNTNVSQENSNTFAGKNDYILDSNLDKG